MKRLVCLLLFTAIATTARAELCADWSRRDTWLQGIGSALLVVDWAQTRTFTAERPPRRSCERNADRYHCTEPPGGGEINTLLGEHPDPAVVNAYFVTILSLHLLTSCSLGPETRGLWQSLVIGLEAGTVWHNHRIGVRISSSW